MTAITNHSIENHAMLTKYCMVDLKEEFQFAERTAVITVGTNADEIGVAESTFKTEDEEAVYNIKKSTVQYKTTMVNSLVKSFTSDVDFVIDSPATLNFFGANLSYLGLEHTPQTHVD